MVKHQEKTTDLPQVVDKLYQVKLSVANLPTDGNRTHN